MNPTGDQAAVRAATELIRQDDGRQGGEDLRKRLADAGYSEAVIDQALRVSRDEAFEAYLTREWRRREGPPRLRRSRVAAVVVAAMAIGYTLIALAASSLGIGPSPGLIFFSLAAFILLPTIAAGFISSAAAGTRTARTALVILIVGLPAAMVAGWLSVSGGAVDDGTLMALLVMAGVIAIPALIGYGFGTSMVPSQR